MSNKHILMGVTLGSLLIGFFIASITEDLYVRFVVILIAGMLSGWSLRAWWTCGLWEMMDEWRFMAHRRLHTIEEYEKEIVRLGGNPEKVVSGPCNDKRCGSPSEWEY